MPPERRGGRDAVHQHDGRPLSALEPAHRGSVDHRAAFVGVHALGMLGRVQRQTGALKRNRHRPGHTTVTRIGKWAQHRWARTRLPAYVDGELTARQRRRLERHADACPECGPALRSLIRVIHALRALPRPPAPTVADRAIARLRREAGEREARR